MSGADMKHVVHGAVAAMRDVARAVILPRFRRLATHQIKSKTSPSDVVTVADEESERMLGPRLAALVEGAQVIGEEASFANPALFALLEGEDPVWVIDPIDGTANFVNGVAAFGVIAALVHRGETRVGVIYDPLEDRALWAVKGQGAWTTAAAGEGTDLPAVIAAGGEDLKTMVAAMHNKDLVALRGKFARNIRLGSAAHDYWALTDGRSQVLAYHKLKPWDHAAGLLIHEEAGGYNRLLSGTRYSPAAQGQLGILCAPSAPIWRKIKEMVPDVEYPAGSSP